MKNGLKLFVNFLTNFLKFSFVDVLNIKTFSFSYIVFTAKKILKTSEKSSAFLMYLMNDFLNWVPNWITFF